MKKLIVSATQRAKETYKNTKIFKSLSKFGIDKDNPKEGIINDTTFSVRINDKLQFMTVTENKHKLSTIYNKSIQLAIDLNFDAIIFVHDDVSIQDLFFNEKIEKGLNENDIIGLAGATRFSIDKNTPCLWHLMSQDPEKGRRFHSGSVTHPTRDGLYHTTAFGPTPQKVKLLDGLFLACKVSSLNNSGVRFDESNPCIAHFYDLDFSIEAEKAGLSLSTWPIWVVHDSPGLSQFTEEFLAGQEWFRKKHS